jgi:hypothetical protein
MKTSSELQRQSVIRKISYFGLILVLFTVMSFSGRFVSLLRGGQPSTWTISHQAERLQLSELSQGQADLAGSTVRLTLTGTRGFAICAVWILTMEAQKRHEWNRVETLTLSVTKLQPHFLTPWLYQSWNLSYNVSVESDRVRDKYFYISKGISLLAEGEKLNRGHGVADDGTEYEVGNPDMRFWIGFYYMNKFGVSDEANTLKSLLQMSSIKPSDRMGFRQNGKLDADKFKSFVKENPQLCRRLRDYLRCNRPDDLADFLEDNAKLPTRFEERDGKWELKRKWLDQFPVVPDSPVTMARISPDQDFHDYVDSNLIAWSWHRFAQDPLPPVTPGKPSFSVSPDYDKFRYRMPRQPVSIIFRQYPPRCQTAIAERLQKEGWFDDQGWIVDEGRLTDRWFPEERVIARAGDPHNSSLDAWRTAYEMWKTHGELHGLNLPPEKIDNLAKEAQAFRSKFGLEEYMMAREELVKDQLTPELQRSYDAHMQLIYLAQNLSLTNFKHFLYQAEGESDPRVAEARKLLFQAETERKSGNPEPALRLFEQAFVKLTGDKATGTRGLLETYPNFRNDTRVQEDLYEKQITYLDLLYNQRGPTIRAAMTACGLSGCFPYTPEGALSACLYQYSSRHRELPNPFAGPLDGPDSTGQPWVSEANANSVRTRLGLAAPVPTGPPPKQALTTSPTAN